MSKPSRSGDLIFFPRSLSLMLQGIIEGERQLAMGGEPNIPLADLYETEDTLRIELELPGCSKDKIEVYIIDTDITVEARKEHLLPQPAAAKESINFLRMERKFGRYSRRIKLPTPCNTQKVRAFLKNGLLVIEIPLVKERRGKRIKVEIEAG